VDRGAAAQRLTVVNRTFAHWEFNTLQVTGAATRPRCKPNAAMNCNFHDDEGSTIFKRGFGNGMRREVESTWSNPRRRVVRRQQNTTTISWWCLRVGLVVLFTIGLVEICSNIPPTWLPLRAGAAILESKHQAHEVLVFNLHRDFGVDSILAHRIVRSAREASATTQMPLTLLLAVMAVESGFNRAARNNNDVGLMQVNLGYHPQEVRELKSPDELHKIDTNVKIGARILRGYLDEEAGRVYPALRRYNGLGKTNNYPERVLMAKDRFDHLLTYAGH
jgi:Transglycosylase SLT domain